MTGELPSHSTVRWSRVLLAWAGILLLAILNGALREAWLLGALGPVAGLVLSGVLLALLIIAVASASVRWMGIARGAQAWRVGALWLALTLVFEFGFGSLVQHKSWSELLQAYTFAGGNVWPLVLAVVLVSPWLGWRLRGGASARMRG